MTPLDLRCRLFFIVRMNWSLYFVVDQYMKKEKTVLTDLGLSTEFLSAKGTSLINF